MYVEVILLDLPTFLRLRWMLYKLSRQVFESFLHKMNSFSSYLTPSGPH